MNMTSERFREIVDAYGNSTDRWPESERQDALTYLYDNPEAQKFVNEASDFDNLLNEVKVPDFPGLKARVLNQELPARSANAVKANAAKDSLLENILDWILPSSGQPLVKLWRPAFVACLPLLFGFYLGTHFTFGIDNPENNWDVELALMSLSDYSETFQ